MARLTNGTLSFHANQVTLSLPAPGAVPSSIRTERLSKEFPRAVIEEMGVIGEWRAGLVNAIQSGSPFTRESADSYGRNAENKLAPVSTTVTTQQDGNLLPMLRNEFNIMRALSDRYVALHTSQSFVSPDALDGDPLNRQIPNCANGLAPVTAGGQFADVPSCH